MTLVSSLKIIAGCASSIIVNLNGCYYKNKCHAYTYTPTDDVEGGTTPWNWSWNEKSTRPTGATEPLRRLVFIINHGEIADGKLTEKGVEQAKLCGSFLQTYITRYANMPKVTNVYVASDVNCRRTYSLAIRSVTHKSDDFSTNIYKDLTGVMPVKPSPLPKRSPAPAQEQIIADKGKMDTFFDEFLKRAPVSCPSTEFIFCSGKIANYLHVRLMQLPLDSYLRFGIRDCGVTMYDLQSNGTVWCHCFNETGFLPINMRTGGL